MIKLSELAVMVTLHDGTVIEFDCEQFEAEIVRSFIAAGNNELWAAEDIIMAVEYALLATDSDEKIFSLIEIESIIGKILSDAGFADVAEYYRRTHTQRSITFSPERNYLLQLFRRHAGLTGLLLDAVTDKVITAGLKLQIDSATPELYVALAKHYKSAMSIEKAPSLDRLKLSTPAERPHRIGEGEIRERLSELSIDYLSKTIIKLYDISSLFPAVKIAINLSALAEHAELNPPVTELFLMSGFRELAEVINDIMAKVEQVIKSKTANATKELPLHISVQDMAGFAGHWLEAEWPECRGSCRDMMSFLEDLLERKPFKLTIG